MATLNKNFLSTGSINAVGSGVPRVNNPRAINSGAVQHVANQLRGMKVQPREIRFPQIEMTESINTGIKADAVINFAQTWQQKSLERAEKKNTLDARNKLVEVRDKLRDLGYNQETGYFLTQGRETLDSRKVYQQRVESIIAESLAELNPDARLKAFSAIQAERNQTLDNMASYAAQQFRQYEADTDELELFDLQETIKHTLPHAELTDNTVRQELMKIFPNNPDGTPNVQNEVKRRKAYETIAQQVVESVSLSPAGVSGAIDRYTFYADKVGADTLFRMQKQLEIDIRAHNTEVDRAETKRLRDQKQKQIDVHSNMLARIMDPTLDNPTEKEISERLFVGDLLPSQANSLRASLKATPGETDWVIYGNYIQELEAIGSNPGNEDKILTVRMRFLTDNSLADSERRTLMTMSKTLISSAHRTEYNAALDTIKGWLTPHTWNKTLHNAELAQQQNIAIEDFHGLLSNGKSINEALTNMKNRYDPILVGPKHLPALRNGFKPKSFEDVQRAKQDLANAYRAGNMTDEDLAFQTALIQSYELYFKEKDDPAKIEVTPEPKKEGSWLNPSNWFN